MVGIYSAIKKVADIFVTLTDLFTRAIFPNIVRNQEKFNRYSRGMIAIGLFYCLLPIVFAKLVFLYLNMPLNGNIGILATLMIGVFGIILYDVFGVNYFIARGQDRIVMRNTLIASLVGLILAYPLIGYLGIIGASINLTLARLLMGGGMLFRYRKTI